MKGKILTLLSFLVISAGFHSVADAQARSKQDFIAIIDLSKAIQNTQDGKAAQAKLKKFIENGRKNILIEETKLLNDKTLVEKKKMILSKHAYETEKDRLERLYYEYQETVAKTEQSIREEELKLTSPILEKMKVVIAEFSKARRVVAVLDKNKDNVIYFNSKRDITDRMSKAYDLKHGKK